MATETDDTETTNTDKVIIAALLCLIIGVWIGNQITTQEVQRSYERGTLCPTQTWTRPGIITNNQCLTIGNQCIQMSLTNISRN